MRQKKKNSKICSNCNVFSPVPSMTLIHFTDFVNRNFSLRKRRLFTIFMNCISEMSNLSGNEVNAILWMTFLNGCRRYIHEMTTMAKNMAKHSFSRVIFYWAAGNISKHTKKREKTVVTIILTKNIYGTCLFSEVLLETKSFWRLGFQLPMCLLFF